MFQALFEVPDVAADDITILHCDRLAHAGDTTTGVPVDLNRLWLSAGRGGRRARITIGFLS